MAKIGEISIGPGQKKMVIDQEPNVATQSRLVDKNYRVKFSKSGSGNSSGNKMLKILDILPKVNTGFNI